MALRGAGAIRRYGILVALALSCVRIAAQGAAAGIAMPDFGGGELRWSVSYAGIRLGGISLNASEARGMAGEPRRVCLVMATDPRLPFPAMRGEYTSWLDARTLRPARCASLSSGQGGTKSSVYVFDARSARLNYETSARSGGKTDRREGSLALGENDFDGVSLLLWMMAMSDRNASREARFVSERGFSAVSLDFSGVAERLPGSGRDIPAYRVRGKLRGKGVAGLTGDFTLWVAADEGRVPLRAVIKLWIGEAVVELDPGGVSAEDGILGLR